MFWWIAGPLILPALFWVGVPGLILGLGNLLPDVNFCLGAAMWQYWHPLRSLVFTRSPALEADLEDIRADLARDGFILPKISIFMLQPWIVSDSMSGVFYRCWPWRPLILVSAEAAEDPFERFITIGHEIGHCMHSLDKKGSHPVFQGGISIGDDEEVVANTFAVHFLLRAHIIGKV